MLASGGSTRAVRSASGSPRRAAGRPSIRAGRRRPGHARGARQLEVPGVRRHEVPMVNTGVRCPAAARRRRRLLGRQVGGVVGLDVADGAVQVGAAAQRPVDDQQVVGGRVLGAGRSGPAAPRLGEPLLQGERQLVEPRRRRAGPGSWRARSVMSVGSAAAVNRPRSTMTSTIRAAPSQHTSPAAKDAAIPGPAAAWCRAPRPGRRCGARRPGTAPCRAATAAIGVDGPPLRPRRLQVKVELGAGFLQGAAVQFLAERHPVPGIPRVDGVGDGVSSAVTGLPGAG